MKPFIAVRPRHASLRVALVVRRYAIATLWVVIATVAATIAGDRITAADQAMLYLPAILLAALGGRGPSLVAAALSVGAFDFFFVEPRLTFAVSDLRSVVTFIMMFVVGSFAGTLVARLRAAEAASRERERSTAALLELTRDVATAADEAGVVAAIDRHSAVQPELAAAVADQATRRLRLAIEAREAALRAKAEELRSALLSSVSHDLRTPLAAITGMATALRETIGPNEPLETIIDEARRLSRLLTNLLSITKVESGASPRRDWVPLEEIVGTALARLDKELVGRIVTVDVPALAHVDPILVEQLLLNLLENAAKHTPPGTPIDVIAWRDHDTAMLEVADRGLGIPAEARTHVFDKFFRGTASVPGAGLGLAVCRGIAGAHRGTIEALPRDGGGTRFVATFPDAEPLPSEALAS